VIITAAKIKRSHHPEKVMKTQAQPSAEPKPEASAGAESKGRRVTIDLTPAAALEVDRLREVTGLTTADVFRYALSLFRIYVDAKRRGHELQIVDLTGNQPDVRIELPVAVAGMAKE
jgi:hypothetical protein